jgi:four helix bundle protein
VKKKTPNAERPTPNFEFGSYRIAERSNGEYVPASKREYDLEDRLLEFAAMIIEFVESLPNTRAGNHIAGQLLRCGTSPLSNHGEVEAAESRICLKELRETKRWLRLVGRTRTLTTPTNLTACLNEVEELIRFL